MIIFYILGLVTGLVLGWAIFHVRHEQYTQGYEAWAKTQYYLDDSSARAAWSACAAEYEKEKK